MSEPVLTAGVILTVMAGQGPARAGTASALTRTITIDSQIGATFAPAPQDPAPKLTAEQASARYEQAENGHRHRQGIPSYVTVYLGLLTWPVGPADCAGCGKLTKKNGVAYTALGELVYGYSWHSCPVSRNPNVRTLPANPCVEWNFLDANTGKQIYDTWQM